MIRDNVIKEVRTNFKIVPPDAPPVIQDRSKLIREYENLCDEKLKLYNLCYPDQIETLLKLMAQLGGRIGGVTRRMRTECIISLLATLRDNNSDAFSYFSTSCYCELSLYLFGVSPTRNALLRLNGDDAAGRITKNGQAIGYAIADLCSQYDDECNTVRSFYNDVMHSFDNEKNQIKRANDYEIVALKRKLKKPVS